MELNKTRYDDARRTLIALEIPLVKEDYNALKDIFGEYLRGFLRNPHAGHQDGRGIIRFKNQRVSELHLAGLHDFVKIGKSIGKLDGLEEINFSYLYLTSLPEEFYNLVNLKSMWVPNNNLTSLSKNINKLKKLEEISIQGNHNLSELPEEILELKNLKRLVIYMTEFNIKQDSKILKELKSRGVTIVSSD